MPANFVPYSCFFICCNYCIPKRRFSSSFINLCMSEFLSAVVSVLFDDLQVVVLLLLKIAFYFEKFNFMYQANHVYLKCNYIFHLLWPFITFYSIFPRIFFFVLTPLLLFLMLSFQFLLMLLLLTFIS